MTTYALALLDPATGKLRPDQIPDGLGSGGGSTDPEVVRDTIAAALRGIQGLTVTADDPGDTITLGVSGVPISQISGLQTAISEAKTPPLARGLSFANGLQPLAINTMPEGGVSNTNASVIAEMARIPLPLRRGASGISLGFTGWYNKSATNSQYFEETAVGSDAVVSISLELPGATKAIPLRVGGRKRFTVPDGIPVLWTDYLDVDILPFAPGDPVANLPFIRMYMEVPTAGALMPAGRFASNSQGGTRIIYTSSPVDQTEAVGALSATGGTSVQNTGIGPQYVFGRPASGASGVAAQPIIGGHGDSILAAGWSDPRGFTASWFDRSVFASGFGGIRIYRSSEEQADWKDAATAPFYVNRKSVIHGHTDFLILPFANDSKNGRTAADMKETDLFLANLYRRRGVRAHLLTAVPTGATSTDSYATVANQTPNSNNAARVERNNWVRDGAPIHAVTKVAVAIGTTSNVLRAGAEGHPVSSYLEIADALEASRDSGTWKVGMTTDGTHPTNPAGHTAMADVVNAILTDPAARAARFPATPVTTAP